MFTASCVPSRSILGTRFGFPFLLAVKGSGKIDILRSLEQRIGHARGVEYREALRQAYRIAEFRLRDTIMDQ